VSKARLVITAVVVEGRSQSEVARAYGVSQSWISRLVKRYRLEGDAAFIPHSRRPHTSPSRLPQPTIDLIVLLREKLARNPYGPSDLRCGVVLDRVVSGDRGAGGLKDDPAADLHGVVGEPFVVAA
jgi:hypothetical protein